MSLTDFYQQLQQYATRTEYRGQLTSATLRVEAHNPMCGDELEICVNHDHQKIETIRFDGHACAVCLASANIMVEQLEGSPISEAANRHTQLKQLLSSDLNEVANNAFNKAVTPLLGIAAYPARIQCALLPWQALENTISENTVE